MGAHYASTWSINIFKSELFGNHSLASMIPPFDIANVASFSGRSGLKRSKWEMLKVAWLDCNHRLQWRWILYFKMWSKYALFWILTLTTVYANYFYDTSVIFSNSFITYREPFRICIGHNRRTDVIGIDCHKWSLSDSYKNLFLETRLYFDIWYMDRGTEMLDTLSKFCHVNGHQFFGGNIYRLHSSRKITLFHS